MSKLLTALFEFILDGSRAKKTKTAVAAAAVAGGAAYFHPPVLDAIKKWEGFRGKAYVDIAGHPTQGYGHTNMAGGPKVDFSKIWSEGFASDVLERDLKQYWDGIGKAVTVPLNTCQQSVLTMWAYNIGVAAARKSSLVRELNQGHYDRVPRKLLAWNKARVNGKLTPIRGLTNRRKDEGKLWKTCK